MDKICDGNPSKSEVIGRSGGDEKTKDHAELTVSCKKKRLVNYHTCINLGGYLINNLIVPK